MRSIRQAESRQDIIDRLQNLTPDSPRRWGNLTVEKVVPHLSDQLRMALGEIEIRGVRGLFKSPPLNYLVIHLMPWPKARAKGPREAFTTSAAEFAADKAKLVELIERFAATPAEELNPLHPLFGRMSWKDWDVLSYRHLDHHLRQFGA